MKNPFLQKTFSLLLTGILSGMLVNAQVASWSFNNTLSGTGTANAVAGNASLGSTIAAGGAFNGGTVYYGEGSWPTGAVVDLNAYLEFSITPTTGNTLTISSLAMQIRRSTTGTSGAGPNSWSLRSNLDGYTTDVASGALTMSSTPAIVATMGIAFMNMPSKVIFRLYGFNATVSSGGLDRFVYDDIEAFGSTILPIVFNYFNVKTAGQSSDISWQLGGEGNLSSMQIERASDGVNFSAVKEYSGDALNQTTFDYKDALNRPSGVYAYRIQLVSADGTISYSAIQTISFDGESAFQLKAIFAGDSHTVSFRVNAERSGNYVFSLYNLSGNKVAGMSAQLGIGIQSMEMDNRPLRSGIYILVAESGNQKTSTKVMVL